MANRAYASVSLRDPSAAALLGCFERLLDTVPFSPSAPGLASLVVRAVDPAEAPLAEHDLRGAPLRAPEWVALAREHQGPDCAYEAQAWWDLWALDAGQWQRRPHRLELVCYSVEFDGGAGADSGHLVVDLGFEHLFTGHAGVLLVAAPHGASPAAEHGASPEERRFLQWVRDPGHRAAYRRHTVENVRALMEWMERIRAALPGEQYRLWSQGEEDFEARLDGLLAAR